MDLSELDPKQQMLIAKVCRYLCRGNRAAKIAELMNTHAKPGDKIMKRQGIFPLVEMAGLAGWLEFAPPPEYALGEEVRRQFTYLRNVVVSSTSVIEDVANRAAETILDLFQEYAGEEFRAGFSGGYTMKLTVQRLARKLMMPVRVRGERSEPLKLPNKIVFFSLSAGFDTTAAGSDATAFFTYLTEPQIREKVQTQFVLLHAPPIVRSAQRDELMKEIPAIANARYQVSKPGNLHLIVTSAADVEDPHSQLIRYLKRYGELNSDFAKTLVTLREEECVGDMLWLPFNVSGGINAQPYRTMTLLELDELPKLMDAGTRVLLVIGPCSDPSDDCRHPKTRVLKTLLKIQTPLISHLVVDSRTALDLVRPATQGAASSASRP